MFSREFCEISKNTFSYRTPLVADSGIGFISIGNFWYNLIWMVSNLEKFLWVTLSISLKQLVSLPVPVMVVGFTSRFNSKISTSVLRNISCAPFDNTVEYRVYILQNFYLHMEFAVHIWEWWRCICWLAILHCLVITKYANFKFFRLDWKMLQEHETKQEGMFTKHGKFILDVEELKESLIFNLDDIDQSFSNISEKLQRVEK